MRLAVLAASLAAVAAAQGVAPGSKAPALKLTDLKGDSAAVESPAGRPTVVLFISTECPISNAYNDRMIALYRDFSDRVRFIFVNSNDNESASDVEQHRRQVSFPFSVYKDPGNVTADAFGAQLTPEAFVIDSAGIIRYHGAIDDQRNPARVRVAGLRRALDAILNSRKVEPEQTKAFGCTIKRVRRSS